MITSVFHDEYCTFVNQFPTLSSITFIKSKSKDVPECCLLYNSSCFRLTPFCLYSVIISLLFDSPDISCMAHVVSINENTHFDSKFRIPWFSDCCFFHYLHIHFLCSNNLYWSFFWCYLFWFVMLILSLRTLQSHIISFVQVSLIYQEVVFLSLPTAVFPTFSQFLTSAIL